MKSVFISYSTDASKKVKSVSKYFTSLGINSFVFEKDLILENQAQIRNEIGSSYAVVLILSVKSTTSPWASHELGIATALRKQIYVFKNAHNLKLPGFIDSYQLLILDKLEDLDSYLEM